MPEDNEKFDLAFYNKLTEDTLNTNKDLKEYYDKIECIYNGNSICLSGQEAEVTEYEDTEAIEDDQGSESGICSNNDQVYNNFLSKFSDTLVKFLDQYDYSSLLQHDHSNQCVYFKYWFYDKILKNIFSKEKLECFYKEIENGDKEDEYQEVTEPTVEDGDEPIEEFFDQPDEEEEELVDGYSLDSEEEDIDENEVAKEGKNQHKYRGEDNDSNEILLKLGKSNSCNIHKLNLNQIRDMKFLYDYLEYNKSKNGSSIENEISKSTYCSSFNKNIELYNEKSKCKSDYFDNAYCREVEECRNYYSHAKMPTLSCNIKESASDAPQQSFLSADLSDTKSENLKETPDSTELILTTLHNGDHMKERQTLREGEHMTEPGHTNTQIASTDDMRGSHSMDSEASTSCHHSSVGRSCGSSSQTLSTIPKETENHLKQLQENANVHIESDMDSKEDTGNTNTIVSSASSVLGVSALLFMLYKFTPLGSLINNRRGGINTWDINEEGYDQNLLFTPELGNTNSNNNNYNIGYYSLGNT
ncbi:PIR protein [Plasmodium ovale]|uniref:PIR protein n=1 Tax=Plasmodium ovale TaxID=36330 RepID=A0A1C3KID6_PLAOA|nr:PIR protein [Plasmodium ovale]